MQDDTGTDHVHAPDPRFHISNSSSHISPAWYLMRVLFRIKPSSYNGMCVRHWEMQDDTGTYHVHSPGPRFSASATLYNTSRWLDALWESSPFKNFFLYDCKCTIPSSFALCCLRQSPLPRYLEAGTRYITASGARRFSARAVCRSQQRALSVGGSFPTKQTRSAPAPHWWWSHWKRVSCFYAYNYSFHRVKWILLFSLSVLNM